jgi:hypothetical protein
MAVFKIVSHYTIKAAMRLKLSHYNFHKLDVDVRCYPLYNKNYDERLKLLRYNFHKLGVNVRSLGAALSVVAMENL